MGDESRQVQYRTMSVDALVSVSKIKYLNKLASTMFEIPKPILVQRDSAIVPSESDDTIVQCVQTGGAGQLRVNVLSR